MKKEHFDYKSAWLEAARLVRMCLGYSGIKAPYKLVIDTQYFDDSTQSQIIKLMLIVNNPQKDSFNQYKFTESSGFPLIAEIDSRVKLLNED